VRAPPRSGTRVAPGPPIRARAATYTTPPHAKTAQRAGAAPARRPVKLASRPQGQEREREREMRQVADASNNARPLAHIDPRNVSLRRNHANQAPSSGPIQSLSPGSRASSMVDPQPHDPTRRYFDRHALLDYRRTRRALTIKAETHSTCQAPTPSSPPLRP
jgi:hypothetical protein